MVKDKRKLKKINSPIKKHTRDCIRQVDKTLNGIQKILKVLDNLEKSLSI